MTNPGSELHFPLQPLDPTLTRHRHHRSPLSGPVDHFSAVGFAPLQVKLPVLMCDVHDAQFEGTKQDAGKVADAVCHPRIKLASANLIDRVSYECRDVGRVLKRYIWCARREYSGRATPFKAPAIQLRPWPPLLRHIVTDREKHTRRILVERSLPSTLRRCPATCCFGTLYTIYPSRCEFVRKAVQGGNGPPNRGFAAIQQLRRG